ncbi:MAG: restriction endonuclease [Lachnospiraceae bacterium]|nr:restriction endonuclease [Lachnospiraceae bacterium]
MSSKEPNGFEYEEICAQILKRNGYSKVTVTRASNDQGLDVIAEKKGVRYGIQCKYYNYPVGNKAVQEAYAGCGYYDCDVPVVMTNSTFTVSARELADQLGVELWEGYEPYLESRHQPFVRIAGEALILSGLYFAVTGLVTSGADAKWLRYAAVCLVMLAAAGLTGVFNFRKKLFYFIACILSLSAAVIFISGGFRLVAFCAFTAGVVDAVILILEVIRMTAGRNEAEDNEKD